MFFRIKILKSFSPDTPKEITININSIHLYQINEGIICFHLFSNEFGHFIDDILSSIMILPNNILFKKTFFTYEKFFNICVSIGFLRNNLYPVDFHILYNVNKAYYIFENYFHDHYGILYIKEKNLFYKKCNLKFIKPERYIFINRKLGMKRYFLNFKDVYNNVTLIYNKIKWSFIENITDSINETFIDTAKFWAGNKLVISSAGSSCNNCIFMKYYTGFIVLLSDLDCQFPHHIHELRHFLCSLIWTYFIFCKKLYHYSTQPYNISSNILIIPIKRILFALKNNYWPMNIISWSDNPIEYMKEDLNIIYK